MHAGQYISGAGHLALIGWVLLGFTLIIQIGSVHLAWHYAVDGILAFLIVGTIWGILRRLLERQMPEA